MKYSVVVPCYNEEKNIDNLINVLDKVREERNIEYILVENGSKDSTRLELERVCKNRNDFTIVYVDENKGYGYGLQQGLKKAVGEYVGWIHADMQVDPREMMKFVDYIEDNQNKEIFIKGKRKNRKAFDVFFTVMMTVYETLLFHTALYDIGAIPVLFSRDLLTEHRNIPYDFSIELYMYLHAKKAKYRIVRFPVVLGKREKGQSSWDRGLESKIKQSKRIMSDSIKIRKGEQVL